MACSLDTLGKGKSTLYKELIDTYGEDIADTVFIKIHSEDFKQFFGNWELYYNYDYIKDNILIPNHKTREAASAHAKELNDRFGKGSAQAISKRDGTKKVILNRPINVSAAVNKQGEPMLMYNLDSFDTFTSDKKKAGQFDSSGYSGHFPVPSIGEIKPMFLNVASFDSKVGTVAVATHTQVQVAGTFHTNEANTMTLGELQKEEKVIKEKTKSLEKGDKSAESLRKLELLARRSIDILRKKKTIYEAKNQKGGVAKMNKLISSITREIRDKEFSTAVLNFIYYGFERSNNIDIKSITDIEKKYYAKGATKEDKRKQLQRLEKAMDALSSFDVVTNFFGEMEGVAISDPRFDEEIIDREFRNKYIAVIKSNIQSAKDTYLKLTYDLGADFLMQFNSDPNLTKKKLQSMFVHMTDDVHNLTAKFGAMADSRDQVLALVAKAIERKKNEVAKREQYFQQTKLRVEAELLQKFQGKKVSHEAMYNFMLERDGNGKLTGHYIHPNSEKGKALPAPQLRFLNFFHLEYSNAQKKIHKNFRKGTELPAILKNLDERIADKSSTGVIKSTIKSTQEKFTFTSDETEYIETLTDENGKVIKVVPIKYVSHEKIDPNDISVDLESSLSRFVTMADNYETMNGIVTEIEGIKMLLSDKRQVTQKLGSKKYLTKGTTKENTKSAIEFNAYKMLIDNVDMQLYGEFKNTEFAGNLNVGKTADTIRGLTATVQLGFNPRSALNNLVMGNMANFFEGRGGQFYTSTHLRKAKAIYAKNLPGFLSDATKRYNDNMINVFMNQHNIFQAFDDFGNPLPSHVAANRFMSNASQLMQEGGEHEIQVEQAVAILLSHKVIDGKVYSFQEYMVKEGVANNKAEKKKFEALTSVFETLKKEDNITTSSVSNEEMAKLTERIKALYRRSHGNYSKLTKAAANKQWQYRLALLFRSWLQPGFDRRFAPEKFNSGNEKRMVPNEAGIPTETTFEEFLRNNKVTNSSKTRKEFKKHKIVESSVEYAFNQQLGAHIGGNYRIAYNFMRQLVRDTEGIALITAYRGENGYNNLPEWKKSALKSTVTELATFALLTVVVNALAEIGGDDDDSLLLNATVYQMYRLKSEVGFWINPLEVPKILRSPSATLGMTEKIAKAIGYSLEPLVTWEDWSVYKSGYHKGETKASRYWRDVTPYYGQISSWYDYGEYVKNVKKFM